MWYLISLYFVFDISTVMQTGLEKNLFGNHPVSLLTIESRPPPPAFASDPLMHVSATGRSTSIVGQDAGGYSGAIGIGSDDIVEVDGPNSVNSSLSNQPNFTKTASPAGVRGIFSQIFPTNRNMLV